MTHYDELCVDKDAPFDVIKRAYRQLAKEFHPDRNSSKDAEEKFKKINAAYEILSDEKRRKAYDAECNKTFDLNQIFSSSIFNGKVNKSKTDKDKKKFDGESRLTISIPFREAILGFKDKKITNVYKKECSACHGYGGEYKHCSFCNGRGMVNKSDGFISMNITCPRCNGESKTLIVGCPLCNSKGYEECSEEIFINIPEGLEQRTKLFSKGKGNYFNGVRGDLFIDVTIEPEQNYRRSGNDIIKDITVSVFDVLLGKSINIEYFKGDFVIDLAGINLDERIVKTGFGTKTVNSNNYGDLVITVNITIPKISEKQKKILVNLLDENEF